MIFSMLCLWGTIIFGCPPAVTQPIIATATLILVIMLMTGIILWRPKNKAARQQRFTIKWIAKWRRVNYNLHHVLGFYITSINIFIALTGLVWSVQWFAKTLYWCFRK